MPEQLLERPRLAEDEVYGRSLGTIHRLGAFMVGKSLSESVHSPEADQARAEFYTSVEEGFGTDMELGGGLEVRDFDRRAVIQGKVMSKDLKTSISTMTADGLDCAQETARKDERFLPQLIRSFWDHENALLVDRMVQGETGYNTRVVVSPFPEEAAKQSGNGYWRDMGYVPHLKRGFVQIYHATKEGLLAGSLSFDGSDKAQLRDIFGKHGIEIPADEVTDNWLNYAITGTFSEDQAKAFALALADQAGDTKYKKNTNTIDVTRSYGGVMDRVFDDSYVHICESLARGRQTEAAQQLIHQLADKAHNFNDRYAMALYRMRADTSFTDYDSRILHELLVYSTIEMMRALHLRKTEHPHNPQEVPVAAVLMDPAQMQSINNNSFQNMLSGFGAEGARSNRTYSACGLSISLGGDRLTDGEPGEDPDNPQAAFGGVEKKRLSDDKYGSRYFDCPKCGKENERKKKNELLPVCLHCHKDVTCGQKESSKKSTTGLFALAA